MSDIDYSQFKQGDRVKITFNGKNMAGEVEVTLNEDGEWDDLELNYVHLMDVEGYRFIAKSDITAITKIEEPIIANDVVWFKGKDWRVDAEALIVTHHHGLGRDVRAIDDIPDDAIWLVRGGKPQVGEA